VLRHRGKGGAGSDTFILAAKFGQQESAPTTAFDKQAAYIADFQSAGANSLTADHDFIAFSGFGAGSTLTLDHKGTSGTNGVVLYYYNIFDTHIGHYYDFDFNSLNGKALGAGDYSFTSSMTPLST
jgi:hypothetical protein